MGQVFELEIDPGETIKSAIFSAIEVAQEKVQPVQFNFNGIVVQVTGDSEYDIVKQEYRTALAESQKEYENSPRYKKLKQKQDEELKADQLRIDSLLASLSEVLKGNDFASVVVWCGLFAEINDNNNLKFDKKVLVEQLKVAGWLSGVCTGKDFNEDDPENYARYIVGQCISNLESGMPIHPIAKSFADKWVEKFPKLEAKSHG